MSGDLEERLKSHARAFDGLLSLIPAKLYYGEDNSDQWQRKKQTKEQKKAARLAKLDPDNVKTAKDVMDERAAAAAKKRKRNEDDTADPVDLSVEREMPKEGLKPNDEQKPKKQKTKQEGTQTNGNLIEPQGLSIEEKKKRKAEKAAAKRERKRAKAEKAKAKHERQKERKAEATSNEPTEGVLSEGEETDFDDGEADLVEAIEIEPSPKSQGKTGPKRKASPLPEDLTHESSKAPSTASPSPPAGPSDFDSPNIHSASSSISSIQVPQSTESKTKTLSSAGTSSNGLKSKASAEDIKERLQARIEALRAARKADGPNGQPARSRQELLEARRKKEEERRAHKKELRRKAKEEEAQKQDEEIARRFSPGGSGSLLASPRSPMSENMSFSFGRVAFGDGTQADATLSTLLDPVQKKKGSSDTRSQLNAAEQKAARLAALDPAKRAEIEQKDMWLNARKKAHGDKLKDDTSLLKKALKRQEKQKGKSEKEWKARTEEVEKGIQARQKKREDNLKKRKEERGAGGKKGKGVKRPGFEGSFKAKHGNSGSRK
ncbi:putative 60s ribosome biogenesis protein [Phaeomoniella chlamydospora]|uniref:Putative 60s ribosome biogenesis protein n=1 Tax=Phaeomoniella chlamydospora TaxID=158046 RepID=A0A0G2GES1_PHACM|nr:putative 60s ribosome biogenesis protein [Phaeomoniella chlamydospora]